MRIFGTNVFRRLLAVALHVTQFGLGVAREFCNSTRLYLTDSNSGSCHPAESVTADATVFAMAKPSSGKWKFLDEVYPMNRNPSCAIPLFSALSQARFRCAG
jgi:hypothetical protein